MATTTACSSSFLGFLCARGCFRCRILGDDVGIEIWAGFCGGEGPDDYYKFLFYYVIGDGYCGSNSLCLLFYLACFNGMDGFGRDEMGMGMGSGETSGFCFASYARHFASALCAERGGDYALDAAAARDSWTIDDYE